MSNNDDEDPTTPIKSTEIEETKEPSSSMEPSGHEIPEESPTIIFGGGNEVDAPSSEHQQGEEATLPPATKSSKEEETNQEEPSPPKQRQAVVAPLPLEWTRMAECSEDIDKNPANIVRYPWDVIDIDPNDTELTIVGTAGQKITRMGRELHTKISPNITNLCFRSHLIRTMEGIGQLKHLEILELYDNQIDELRELDGSIVTSTTGGDLVGGKSEEDTKDDGEKEGNDNKEEEDVKPGLPGTNLRVLDISYNVIRDMGPVSLCPNLQELCEWYMILCI